MVVEGLKWHTEQIRWVDMVTFDKNARKIKVENRKNLAESLKEFDVVDIPTLDVDNVIIGGHQRCMTMIHAGRGEELTDVRKPNRKLTEAEFKKLNLILNSDKYRGEFDLMMLRDNFSEFDLGQELGIDLAELDKDVAETNEVGKVEADPELPIVPKYSEKYSAVVIVIDNSIDENFVRSVLGLGVEQDYKTSNKGESYVTTAKSFIEKWNSR
ncbi:hypothetical protein [Flectobacillus roseus]|uniref:hypothetical protein n=1 Tax=Flectobacillus roseus TaxID=502259 RepID=UPI0024B809FD|nr:hypothetical protein [Flectobacillus roseus]MDI9871322.1 hypothetical protein [Flectobacillus roseus]MDI9872111.1 hypothetical protein [Flectobacillus roseus]